MLHVSQTFLKIQYCKPSSMLLNSKLIKLFKRQYLLQKRGLSQFNDALLAQCLNERTLLQVSGVDTKDYLQGLITNDMKHLQDGASSMFTMFLNSKGRVLYDSIIYSTNEENTYYIECDASAASSLESHIMRYKVRRKVQVSCLKDELDIWSLASGKNFKDLTNAVDYKLILNSVKKNLSDLMIVNDPRLSSLGLRIICPKNFNIKSEIENNANIQVQEENFYKLLRYKLGVAEGQQELPPEKCIPMEANGDYLHGISFHKGCYIGQELTARTHHTGVIRKRLMPLVFDEELKINENGIPIFAIPELNKSIGKLQGIEQTNGVGLLRIEEALKAKELLVLDKKCKTHRPFWWPAEAPKERMKIG